MDVRVIRMMQVETKRQGLPTRAADGRLLFKDHPEFYPNLTPKEVWLRGVYMRPSPPLRIKQHPPNDQPSGHYVARLFYIEAPQSPR